MSGAALAALLRVILCCCWGAAGAPALAQQPLLTAHQLQQLASRHGVCNVTVAIIRHRELQATEAAQGCGADVALRPDAVFQAASLSKPLFAYLVLKLVAEGRLDFDASVDAYLPDGYAHLAQPHRSDSVVDLVPAAALRGVTARNLLNHTAGLPNWSGGPLVFKGAPDARWRYSGEGYLLLQRVVERLLQRPLEQAMQEQVFGPLGMTHSSYATTPEGEQALVQGAWRDGTTGASMRMKRPIAAYSLRTSARDYGMFLAALLKDADALRRITDLQVPVNPKLGLRWGAGWGIAQETDAAYLWQWGSNPGYRSFVMMSAQSGDGFVMFTAQDGGLLLARSIAEHVFPGRHPLFRWPGLRDGVDSLLCEGLDICL